MNACFLEIFINVNIVISLLLFVCLVYIYSCSICCCIFVYMFTIALCWCLLLYYCLLVCQFFIAGVCCCIFVYLFLIFFLLLFMTICKQICLLHWFRFLEDFFIILMLNNVKATHQYHFRMPHFRNEVAVV